MALRTYVSMSVRSDHLEEARQMLWGLDPAAKLGQVYRSDAPDGITGLSISLAGDVRESVDQQLGSRSDLEYKIEVRDEEE